MTSIDLTWFAALAVEAVAAGIWAAVMGVWIVRARRRPPIHPIPWVAMLALPVTAAVAALVRLWAVAQLGLPVWSPAVSVFAWSAIAIALTTAGIWSRRVAQQLAEAQTRLRKVEALLAERGIQVDRRP